MVCGNIFLISFFVSARSPKNKQIFGKKILNFKIKEIKSYIYIRFCQITYFNASFARIIIPVINTPNKKGAIMREVKNIIQPLIFD